MTKDKNFGERFNILLQEMLELLAEEMRDQEYSDATINKIIKSNRQLINGIRCKLTEVLVFGVSYEVGRGPLCTHTFESDERAYYACDWIKGQLHNDLTGTFL